MKPPVFAYHSPATLAEALALLAQKDNARVLAGGQSLMPMLNLRIAFPDDLVDLGRIGELSFIKEEGGAIAFGAMTRQRDIEFSPLVTERLPLMAEAIRWVGHRQTRNRGTIGGSLCHLDPSAELPAVAMAMDATLRIASANGTRDMPMSEFPAGFMTTVLAPDEILAEIRITPWPKGHGWAFTEFARRHGDFAVVSVAVLLAIEANGRIGRASVTLGGVGMAPVRMPAAEQLLTGAACEPATFERAAAACGSIDALGDIHAPAWYRQKLARTLSARAFALAVERAQGGKAGAKA